MKRIIPFLIVILLLSSCKGGKVQNTVPKQESSKQNEIVEAAGAEQKALKTVMVRSSEYFNISKLREMGFNTVILQTPGIRIANGSYKTDFKALRNFKKAVGILNNSSMSYIIEITSGPGFSEETSSLFGNKAELKYFSKMVVETIDRCGKNPNFKGISINLKNPNIPQEIYYSTVNNIYLNAKEKYEDIDIVFNLHPLSFDTGFKNLPTMDGYKTVKASVSLSNLSYPGNGISYKENMKINKNSMLELLKELKSIKGKDVIVDITVPYNAGSDIFIQDMFEISKTLGLKLSISYGNGSDIYDFTTNTKIMKIIKRH